MNKSLLFSLIVIRLIYIILAILVAAIVAGIIAAIAIQYTEDVESIVIYCLGGVWIVEVILYIARCRMTYYKRIKAFDEINTSEILKKKSNLIKLYVISIAVFAAVFGFVVHNLKDGIVNDILGGTNGAKTESSNDNWIVMKIAIVIILLVIFLVRLGVRKRYNVKKVSETEKQKL